MKINIGKPSLTQIPELRTLWKSSFGDSDVFLDIFEKTAFHPDRCRCVTFEGHVVAALYWFDCLFMDKPVAYIYAVATASSHRGRGLCHALIKDTHKHLSVSGYSGAILVPGSKSLFDFYEGIGYKTATSIKEIHYDASMLHALEHKPLHIRSIDKSEYAMLRRKFLPAHAVLQENENLDFLQTQADFYAGDDFLLVCQREDKFLYGIELLGNTSVIPAILKAFSCENGAFRCPGNDQPFSMYYDFTNSTHIPEYFGFAFD